jgi:hypothetical protein
MGRRANRSRRRTPHPRGLRANVQVTASLTTLMGLDDDPCELAGYGPITADLARAIAHHEGGTWRRLVTDPRTGALLDYGHRVYAAPARLKRFVQGRDVTCRWPNCTQPAALCQFDHIIRWPLITAVRNGQSLCTRHHRIKDEGGWRHELLTPATHPHEYPRYIEGTIKITTGAGQVYYSSPPTIGLTDRQRDDLTGAPPPGDPPY